MENDLKPGKVIDQAYEIINKTYQEIDAMKDDFAAILKEIDPRIKFSEEYSYGPKSLYLIECHTFLFKGDVDEKPEEEFIIGLIIIFSSSGNPNKISSGDGPEIWICKMETKNIKEKTRPWEIRKCLRIDERKYFIDKNLEIGGKIYNYHWKDDDGEEEWTGQFIGYPLTAIKDRTFIKEEIIEKLRIKNYQNEVE